MARADRDRRIEAMALDPATVETILRLHALDDAHGPDPAFVHRLERVLLADTARAIPAMPIIHASLPMPIEHVSHAQRMPNRVNHDESTPAGKPDPRQFPAQFAMAALMLLCLATTVLTIAALRSRADDAGIAPAVLPAAESDPVAFVWQTRGDADPLTRMALPYHLAIDPAGNVWAPDMTSYQFHIVAPDGTIQRAWGSKGHGEGQFNFLNPAAFNQNGSGAAAFDAAGNLYVADPGNFRIQKFGPDLTFLAAWGSKGEGDGQFLGLNDLAIDAQGRILALDELRANVQIFAADGTFLGSWGHKGAGEGELLTPHGLAIDRAGNVLIADTGNQRVQKFSPDGAFLAAWGGMGTGAGRFRQPDDVAVDARGRIYVTDTSNNRVQILDARGRYLAAWGEQGTAAGDFTSPTGIVLDQAGDIYVAEGGGDWRVQKFRPLPPLAP
jgi:DNA-binding beta-propeller fold protein YncE